MDRTPQFRAIARASAHADKDKRPTREKGAHFTEVWEYSIRARQLVIDVTQLRKYLDDKREDYVGRRIGAATMTESERDEMEQQSERTLKQARAFLDTLRRLQALFAKRYPDALQSCAHQDGIASVINAYLNAIGALAMAQWKVRMQRVTDMKRMSRVADLLKSGKPFQRVRFPRPQTPADDVPTDDSAEKKRSETDDASAVKPTTSQRSKLEPAKEHDEGVRRRRAARQVTFQKEYSEREEGDAVMMQENEQLYVRYTSMVDEVDILSAKVTEISRLQATFTEHVERQASSIDSLYMNTVHTTEDIKYGNEQIREAMKRKADMRVWVLFTLIVLTFTLWFLDWYNP